MQTWVYDADLASFVILGVHGWRVVGNDRAQKTDAQQHT